MASILHIRQYCFDMIRARAVLRRYCDGKKRIVVAGKPKRNVVTNFFLEAVSVHERKDKTPLKSLNATDKAKLSHSIKNKQKQ